MPLFLDAETVVGRVNEDQLANGVMFGIVHLHPQVMFASRHPVQSDGFGGLLVLEDVVDENPESIVVGGYGDGEGDVIPLVLGMAGLLGEAESAGTRQHNNRQKGQGELQEVLFHDMGCFKKQVQTLNLRAGKDTLFNITRP